MKVVISIVGTSLISNKLNQYIRSGESLPPEFTNCLDKEKWVNLLPRERKDLRSIVSAIRPDAEEELVTFLQLPSRFNPISASAETHSLKLLIDKLIDEESNLSKVLQQLKLYFIVSNTPAGRACARALMQFYRNIMKVNVANLEIIEKLTGDPKVFQQGITEMIDRLIKLITEERNKGNEVFLNATGGFKPESAYATVCGLLNQVNVCYVHEDFEGELCWLPSIPVGFDFTPWHLSASKVQLALSGEKAAYDSLPAEIKDLMTWDGKVGRFNQLGHVFWATYQDACAKHRLSLQRGLLTERIKDSRLRSKILKFIDGWDNIWVGMQLPQMVDHTQAHCQNLLILAEQLLLPLENFLTEEELYVLIACLWLHDIGHSEPIEIKDDGTEVPLSPQEIRNKHHLLAYQLIKTWPTEFGFPSFNEEAEVIATICKHHKTVNLNEVCERCELTIFDDEGISIISQSKIRLRLITALLQFIDTCDIGVPHR
ncbi:putative CRISPR-associated protein [Dehalococcoidales bacterium]|nr:putative CRISPR-associated protein [Dehalococcoidales bacterium]